MRQLVFMQAGQVAWQEVPDPELSDPRGALVRPLAVARCDLDHPMAAFGLFPGPFAVGHETVAEVIAVGERVSERRVGERVLVDTGVDAPVGSRKYCPPVSSSRCR